MDCENKFKYEYCNSKYFGCSDDNYFKTKCYVSIFSNNCKLNRHYQACTKRSGFGNFYESYGPDSICLKAEVNLKRI